MDALLELGIFGAKALILFVVVAGLFVIIASLVQSAQGARDSLEVKDLNARYRKLGTAIRAAVDGDKEAKKAAKQAEKAEEDAERSTLFVLDFDGDVSASNVDGFREEVTGILQVAREGDEVLVRIESAGGTVTGYGLAAAQMRRLRDRGIHVTASVDTVAASGGYMMACTAEHIIAAPFAVVGSIGVLAIVPNAVRALKKLGVDVHEFTAGKYKRTVTPFSDVTSEAREKFLEDLGETHRLFKEFVNENRPQLDIDELATGEHWHATQAIEFGLVDKVQTSDDFLLNRLPQQRLVAVNYVPDRSLSDRLPVGIADTAEKVWDRLVTKSQRNNTLS
jgi:serine protease SohB